MTAAASTSPRLYLEPVVTVLARPTFAAPAHLEVQWMGESTDGERLAEFAGRLCYMSQHNPAGRSTREYLENIKKQGHGSVLEHANYSLLLEGVSRSLTHELVRHRAGFAYCLSGDTLIYSEHRVHGERVGVKKRALRDIFAMTHTPHGRSRLKLLKLRCLDERTGTFTTGSVARVVHSGVKPVFRIELEDGKTITCTREHRFLTSSGWQPLGEIVGGLTVSAGGHAVAGTLDAELMVNGVEAYRDASWLRRQYHDVGLDQESIARLAGVSRHCIRSWVRRHGLQKPAGSWSRGATPWNKGVTYTAGWHHGPEVRARLGEAKRGDRNPGWEISASSTSPRGTGKLLVPRARRIVSVTYAGEQETYDIEMAGSNHNFVANGIVTHNSQLSQRYVDESQAAFVVPPAMLADDALMAAWREQIDGAQGSYVSLVAQLMERLGWVADKVHRRKMAREAARGVLPNSTETKIVVTGNARAWRTMLELRASEAAELEIRRAAIAILRVLEGEAPAFFSDFEIYQAEDRREAARISYHKV